MMNGSRVAMEKTVTSVEKVHELVKKVLYSSCSLELDEIKRIQVPEPTVSISAL
jgi:hypothetical protein